MARSSFFRFDIWYLAMLIHSPRLSRPKGAAQLHRGSPPLPELRSKPTRNEKPDTRDEKRGTNVVEHCLL